MWIVLISTGSTKNALFLTHTRTVIKEKVFVCPQVIGKAALITQAEVTKKKYQRNFGQTLTYRQNVNGMKYG